MKVSLSAPLAKVVKPKLGKERLEMTRMMSALNLEPPTPSMDQLKASWKNFDSPVKSRGIKPASGLSGKHRQIAQDARQMRPLHQRGGAEGSNRAADLVSDTRSEDGGASTVMPDPWDGAESEVSMRVSELGAPTETAEMHRF